MLQWKCLLTSQGRGARFARRRMLAVLGALFVLQALSGCALEPRNGGRTSSADDMQERLSTVISRNGFSHGLRSERDAGYHLDSVYINIPLDSLKRRHYSLENLMRDVGRICSLPEYSEYPIRVEFAAGDLEDRLYLKRLLLKEISLKANILVTVESDVFNDVLITIAHPDKKTH